LGKACDLARWVGAIGGDGVGEAGRVRLICAKPALPDAPMTAISGGLWRVGMWYLCDYESMRKGVVLKRAL